MPSLASFYGSNPCGYLSKYFPNGIPRIPAYNETTATNRQDASAYLNDAFTASSRLKFEAGLRLDTSNYQLPGVNAGAYLPASGNGYSSAYYLPISTSCNSMGSAIRPRMCTRPAATRSVIRRSSNPASRRPTRSCRPTRFA